MIKRREEVPSIQKLGWYYRYWPSMSIAKGAVTTFVKGDWNSQIAIDPLFNKKAKALKAIEK